MQWKTHHVHPCSAAELPEFVQARARCRWNFLHRRCGGRGAALGFAVDGEVPMATGATTGLMPEPEPSIKESGLIWADSH